jgi:hypothetical protein
MTLGKWEALRYEIEIKVADGDSIRSDMWFKNIDMWYKIIAELLLDRHNLASTTLRKIGSATWLLRRASGHLC